MKTYKNSGVDIQKGEKIAKYLGMTEYGAQVEIPASDVPQKVVLTTDGVGTKILVAEAQNKFDTIGIDLVAMCINDLLCKFARPVAFLDYYATGCLNIDKSKSILDGILKGCKIAGCQLVGGETAEMPGVYEGSKFDLAGFAMGIINTHNASWQHKKSVVAGDLLIGIPSSGPHSNGFSLLRKLLSLENIPLEPTRMYVDEILDNFSYIEAVAHITGGGLHGNIPRILGGRNYCIDIQTSGVWNQWWQDLFELGECTHIEFENVFNCGVGMVLVVKQKNLEFIQEGIPDARIVGKVL